MIQFRPCKILTIGLCLLGSHAAVSAANVDDDAEALKAAALDIEVQALDVEQKLLGLGSEVLTIQVGAFPAGLSLVSASLTIDGEVLARHSFTPLEAQALAQQGLYRLARLGVQRGPHRISVTVAARDPADESGSQPRTFIAEARHDAQPGSTVLELLPDGAGWLATPRFRLVTMQVSSAGPSLLSGLFSTLKGSTASAASGYTPGGADDPVVRNARFLLSTQEYLAAAVELRQLRNERRADALTPDFLLDLSNGLVDYGTLGQAQALLLQARTNGADPDALNDSRRRLAERYYQRGDWSGAWNALGDSPPRTKAAGLVEWQDLQSRILIAQGRLGEAAALLRQIGGRNDFESWARYYNLGVALVADGEVGQGLTVLDRIGSVMSAEPQMRALSDRANLALGTYFLKAGQGATAIAILGRVDAQGPCSSRAMLNLGWAWLAPPGAVQEQVMLGDERTLGPPPEVYSAADVRHDQNLYQRYPVDAFSSAPLERGGDNRVRRALALWSELAERQSEDQTKQEAQLAIAVELQRSGTRGAAARSFASAISALEESIASIGKARQYVQSEGLNADLFELPAQSGYDRGLHKLPPPPVADYLSDTLASRQFQDGLGTLRDIRFLGSSLDGIGQRIDSLDQRYCRATAPEAAAASCRDLQELRGRITALRPRLEVAAKTGDERLRRQLLEQLQVQDNWQSALLADARFELARLYDAAPAAK